MSSQEQQDQNKQDISQQNQEQESQQQSLNRSGQNDLSQSQSLSQTQSQYEMEKKQSEKEMEEQRDLQQKYLQDIQNIKQHMKELDQSLNQSQNRIENLEQKSLVNMINESTLQINPNSQSKISFQAQQIKDQFLNSQEQFFQSNKKEENQKEQLENNQHFLSDQNFQQEQHQQQQDNSQLQQQDNSQLQQQQELLVESEQNKQISELQKNQIVQIQEKRKYERFLSEQQLQSQYKYGSQQKLQNDQQFVSQYNNQSLQTDIGFNNTQSKSVKILDPKLNDSRKNLLDLWHEQEEKRIKERELEYLQLKQEEYRQEQEFYESQKERYKQQVLESQQQYENSISTQKSSKMQRQNNSSMGSLPQKQLSQLEIQQSYENPEIVYRGTSPFQRANIQINHKLREDELQNDVQTMKIKPNSDQQIQEYQNIQQNEQTKQYQNQFSQSQQCFPERNSQEIYHNDQRRHTEPFQQSGEKVQLNEEGGGYINNVIKRVADDRILQELYNKAQKKLNDKEGVMNKSQENLMHHDQQNSLEDSSLQRSHRKLYSQYNKEQIVKDNQVQQEQYQESKKYSELKEGGKIQKDMNHFNSEVDQLRNSIHDKMWEIHNSPLKNGKENTASMKMSNKDLISNEIDDLERFEKNDINFLDCQGKYDQKKAMKNLEQDANLKQMIKEVKERVGENVYNPQKRVLNQDIDRFQKKKYYDAHEHFCEYIDKEKVELDKRKKIIREQCEECKFLLNRGLSTKYCEKHGICYKKAEKESMKKKLPKRLAQFI